MAHIRTLRGTICWTAVVLAVALFAAPGPARATFHLWKITELYSNTDGSVQYIEFATAAPGQDRLDTHVLTATSDGAVRTLTFGANLPGDTTNQRFLVATPGFAALPGAVTPDYVLPCGPFFDPAATSITIDFAGVDVLTFPSMALPTDGANALYVGAAHALSTAANSPTNFAGDDGSLALGDCLIAGTCEPCDDGLFCNGAEICANSACVATTPPCGSLCDEEANQCVECLGAADCDDGEVCTADSCEGGACVNSPVDGNCDDGQFCTVFDMCASGTCAGGNMTPCGDENCNEDGDYCGECAQASDCEDGDPCTINGCDQGRCVVDSAEDGTPCADDGEFCDGPEKCQAGSCLSAGTPCDAETQTCNEDEGVCVPVPEPGAAAAAVAALVAVAALARRRSG